MGKGNRQREELPISDFRFPIADFRLSISDWRLAISGSLRSDDGKRPRAGRAGGQAHRLGRPSPPDHRDANLCCRNGRATRPTAKIILTPLLRLPGQRGQHAGARSSWPHPSLRDGWATRARRHGGGTGGIADCRLPISDWRFPVAYAAREESVRVRVQQAAKRTGWDAPHRPIIVTPPFAVAKDGPPGHGGTEGGREELPIADCRLAIQEEKQARRHGGGGIGDFGFLTQRRRKASACGPSRWPSAPVGTPFTARSS